MKDDSPHERRGPSARVTERRFTRDAHAARHSVAWHPRYVSCGPSQAMVGNGEAGGPASVPPSILRVRRHPLGAAMKVHACILALCLYASAAGTADCTVLRMDGPGEVPLYTTERAMLACYVSLLSADGAESMAQALVGSCADAFRTGVPAGTHSPTLKKVFSTSASSGATGIRSARRFLA